MHLNWFALLSSAALLAPIGLMLWRCAWTGECPLRVGWRLAVTLVAAAGLFALFGPAIIHAPQDGLPGLEHDHLMLRRFDNAAFHHTIVVTVGGAMIVAATQAPTLAIAPLVAILFTAVQALAIRTVWFGMLRNGGMIALWDDGGLQIPAATDVAGAMPVFLPAGITALVAQVMLGDPTPKTPPGRDRNGMLATASMLLFAGLVAHVTAASVMQSPTTVMNAAMNVLRAAAAGAVVGAVLARMRASTHPAQDVAGSMLAAALAITAVAGRAPGVVALAIGSAAAVLLPVVCAGVRALGGTDTTRLIGICLTGPIVALPAAAPFAVAPEPMPVRLAIQLIGGVWFALLCACLSVSYCLVVRAVARRVGRGVRTGSAGAFTAR